MIKKVEKVIKGMNRFSSEDIALILETEPLKIEPVLNSLEQNGKIKKISKTTYSKIQKISEPIKEKTTKKEPKIKNVKKIKKKPLIKLKPREFKITRITELEGYEEYFFASPKTKGRIQKYIRLMKETHGMKTAEINEYIKKRKSKDKVSVESFLKARRKIITSGLKELVPKGGKNIPPELFAYFKKFYLSPKSLTSKEARAEAIKLFIKKYPKCRLRQIPNEQILIKKLQREYATEEIHKYRTPNFSLFDMEELEKA